MTYSIISNILSILYISIVIHMLIMVLYYLKLQKLILIQAFIWLVPTSHLEIPLGFSKSIIFHHKENICAKRHFFQRTQAFMKILKFTLIMCLFLRQTVLQIPNITILNSPRSPIPSSSLKQVTVWQIFSVASSHKHNWNKRPLGTNVIISFCFFPTQILFTHRWKFINAHKIYYSFMYYTIVR